MIVSAPAAGCEPPVADELGQQLGVVDHLVLAAEVGVLVRQRVEAVRAVGDDLRHAGLVERRHVLLGEAPGRRTRCPSAGRGRRCSTRAAPRIAKSTPAACSSFAVDRAVVAGALVERRGAADPVEVLGRGVAGLEDADAEPLGPVGALGLRLAPRVATPARRRAASARPRPGSCDSTITRWRRRSTMWSTCSIDTGHSWTHAPQVTQSQTTSSGTALATSGVGRERRRRRRPRRAGSGPPRTAGRAGP